MFFAQIGPYAPAPGVEKRKYQGVVNAGSGTSRSFNEVTKAIMQVYGEAEIEYVPFPEDLKDRYQHFTEADLKGLRALGCDLEMTQLEAGIKETLAVTEPVPA
jgi:ADP-L-glycero-D-manno-heptose 6-epimerase